jgi:hypothetical protein
MDYSLLIYLNILSLIVGYLLGSFLNIKINIVSETQEIKSPLSKDKQKDASFQYKPKPITIDSKTYVTKTDTTNLEKKYEEIAETTQSDESISESVNKLKNFKK